MHSFSAEEEEEKIDAADRTEWYFSQFILIRSALFYEQLIMGKVEKSDEFCEFIKTNDCFSLIHKKKRLDCG